MQTLFSVIVVIVVSLALAASARVVKQHEDGVLFRFGRVIGDLASE